MKVLRLNPDAVKAVLDSMESNDHCTRAYHGQITELRDQIEEFAGNGGLILQHLPESSEGSGIAVNVQPRRVVIDGQEA